MCTHLAKRGSTYYYRRKTPTELVHIFGKEVMKSLGTKDKKVAEAHVRKLGAHYDDLFASHTAKLAGTLAPTQVTPPPVTPRIKRPRFDDNLDIEDAESYAFLFLKQLRAQREKALSNGTWTQFNDYLDKLIADADEYIKTGEHPFEDNPRPMWKLEAELKAATALRNNTVIPFTDSMFKASKDIVTKVTTNAANNLLSELVTKWAAERKPTAKTVAKMTRVIDRFELVVGKLSITALTKKHAVAFKDALLAEGSSPANINQYLRELNTLLNYACLQAIIENNPASGLKVKVSESAKEKRIPFDLPALNAIFNSPVYTSSARPNGGKGEAAYWLPLIALYTGARLDEICQLRVTDIYEESYQDEQEKEQTVWMLRITDDGVDQKLKNAGSRRRVPIHKALIDLGFIKYVKAQTSERVFPELTPARAYGSYSANWSKWFSNYLRKTIKVSDTKMVFHSFRHCFKDYARLAGIPSDVHNAITGHSSGDVADNYGSDKYPLRPLVEAMSKYKVTGLVLASQTKKADNLR